MSKVVFVGNVPYNMGEKELIEVFRTVGTVAGFRLVVDRETGKPKGYGFCEFMDHETAASAVRNLNGQDCGGRPLRIDLADSDPFLEGKTTVNGEIVNDSGETRAQWRQRQEHNDPNAFMKSLPPGAPLPPGVSAGDAITNTLATMNPNQINEVLAQMKAFVINHPDQARHLLATQPQLSYALFQALLLNKIVDQAILQRMLSATQGGQSRPPPQIPSSTVPQMQAPAAGRFPPFPPTHSAPPPMQQPPYYQNAPIPPPSVPVAPPVQAAAPPPAATPPQAAAPQFTLPDNIDPSQRAMLQSVLTLPQEKIQSLPPNEREAILMLRAQFLPPNAV